MRKEEFEKAEEVFLREDKGHQQQCADTSDAKVAWDYSIWPGAARVLPLTSYFSVWGACQE